MRVRIRKTISLVLCGMALFGALCAPALAAVEDDTYYSGVLDAVTGEPVTSQSAPTRVRISETTYYDREARSFVYPTGSGIYEVRANVADGMIVSEPVSITADDGIEVVLSRNGTTLEEANLSEISLPGSYTVGVTGLDSAVNLFGFTIVGATSNLSGGYVMPEGFYILEATLDGEETYFERNFIGMGDEGLYEIEYVCPETTLHYTLSTIIDHTPPELTLEGKLDKDGRFHSAVQISGFQSGDSVAMTRDGADVSFPSDGRLTEAGMYQLLVFDAAGNSTSEQFTILVYLDFNSLLFFALVCLSLAGVLGYVLFRRKKLKVV
ncbi:MAG: hypothetical protein IJV43_00445 [Oscillospiraceae bacterium]|nr:hypothetical protein [Oscillospiraceae bacterium]